MKVKLFTKFQITQAHLDFRYLNQLTFFTGNHFTWNPSRWGWLPQSQFLEDQLFLTFFVFIFYSCQYLREKIHFLLFLPSVERDFVNRPQDVLQSFTRKLSNIYLQLDQLDLLLSRSHHHQHLLPISFQWCLSMTQAVYLRFLDLNWAYFSFFFFFPFHCRLVSSVSEQSAYLA